MSNILKNSLLIGSGFAGGLIAGCFLSRVSEKEKLQHMIERVEKRLEELNQRSLAMKLKSAEQLQEIRDKLRKELSNPVPDLYKATESLTLEESDLADV